MLASQRGFEAGPAEYTPSKVESLVNVSKTAADNNETIMAFVEDKTSKIDYLDFDGLLN